MTGALTSQQWAQLAVTGLAWLVVPLAVGVARVVRARSSEPGHAIEPAGREVALASGPA